MISFECRAVLLDLDGTLVNSLPAVDRCWSAWAERHGMDPAWVVSQIHGRRSIDSIRMLRPDLDAEAEDAWLRAAEAADTEGVVAIPGSIEFVSSLPDGRWAVVTSGTSEVAHPRMRAAGIPIPSTGVHGEDVSVGKPDPAAFLLGAERLGYAPADCLAFEDTVAGIRSAKAAGTRVVGISTWHTAETLADADAVAPDFRLVKVLASGDKLTIQVTS